MTGFVYGAECGNDIHWVVTCWLRDDCQNKISSPCFVFGGFIRTFDYVFQNRLVIYEPQPLWRGLIGVKTRLVSN